MLDEFYIKTSDIEILAEKAMADESLLSEVLEGLKNKNETLRYNCHKVLSEISRNNGELLYPHWDYLVEQLDSKNTYHKLSSLVLLANLTDVDKDNRIEKIYKRYIDMLRGEGTILAIYAATSLAKIASVKSHLREEITDRLLDIDRIYQGKQLELTKAAVIEAFDSLYDQSESKEKIKEFAVKQLDSKSNKTKKIAKAFLNKRG